MSLTTFDLWKCDRCGKELTMEHDSAPRSGWVTVKVARVDATPHSGFGRTICDECADALDKFWAGSVGEGTR